MAMMEYLSYFSKEMGLNFLSKLGNAEIYGKQTCIIEIARAHVFDFSAALSVEFLPALFPSSLNIMSCLVSHHYFYMYMVVYDICKPHLIYHVNVGHPR